MTDDGLLAADGWLLAARFSLLRANLVDDLHVLRLEPSVQRLDQVVVQADPPGIAQADLAARAAVGIDDRHRAAAAAVGRQQVPQLAAFRTAIAGDRHAMCEVIARFGEVEHVHSAYAGARLFVLAVGAA